MPIRTSSGNTRELADRSQNDSPGQTDYVSRQWRRATVVTWE